MSYIVNGWLLYVLLILCDIYNSVLLILQKTIRNFSRIGIDHCHEQNNEILKDDSGIIGLTNNPDNPEVLLKFMLSTSEEMRVINEIEQSMATVKSRNNETNTKHWEHTDAFQKRFAKQVTDVSKVVDQKGNFFTEESEDLFRINTGDVMPQESKDCLKSLHIMGKEQFQTFWQERIVDGTKPINDPIHKNPICLFNERHEKKETNVQEKMTLLQEQASMWSE